jgi:TolB protein
MSRRPGLLLLLTTLGAACSDGPAGPRPPLDNPGQGELSALVVSEAVAPAGALVSLPVGTLSDVVSVRIRNLTSGGAAPPVVPIVDGGFDPAPVPAAAGDRLGLELVHGDGTVTNLEAPVPIKRPPVVVRVSPAQGRTDVALSVRPTVVFSEPMDPRSLPVGMRLFSGGTLVSVRVELLQPWVAALVPLTPLEPGTAYRVEVTRNVTDQSGIALEAPVQASFTTAADTEPFLPALAFVRLAQPAIEGVSGPPAIYLATADGSRVRRLTDGEGPAWSPDGRRIAFVRGAELRLIEVDGSGERLLAAVGGAAWAVDPSWSPDGTRLVFGVGYGDGLSGDVFVLDVSPPGTPVRLIGTGNPNTEYAPGPAWPQWSPDGRSISFVSIPIGWDEPWQLMIMDADGSDVRPLVPSWPPCEGIESCEYVPGPIVERHAWSPDGSRIVATFRLYYPPTLSSEARNATALVSFGPAGDEVRVDFAEPREDNRSYLEHPTWSPDGRSLAFAKFMVDGSCTPPACPMRIWTVSLENGAARQLIPSADGPGYWHRQPAWRPAVE